MALADIQAVLARLFTNAPFRDAFFADPAAVGRSCGLDPAEARTLMDLSRGEVDGFAATLTRKRIGDVSKVLPLTARVLGAAFGGHVRPALAGAARPGRHYDDARAVTDRLGRLARDGALEPPWAADLARYEAAFSDAARRRMCVLVRRFRFPVARLAMAIMRGAPVADATPCMTIGVWVRWPGWRGVFHRAWPGGLQAASAGAPPVSAAFEEQVGKPGVGRPAQHPHPEQADHLGP
jgi:hypothetical protein